MTRTNYAAEDAMRMWRAVSLEGTQGKAFRGPTITDTGAKDVTVAAMWVAATAINGKVSLRKASDHAMLDEVQAPVATTWDYRGYTLSHPGGDDFYVAIHASDSETSQEIWLSMPMATWVDPVGEGHVRPFVALAADGLLVANEMVITPTADADFNEWGEAEVAGWASQDTAAGVRGLVDVHNGVDNASRRTLKIDNKTTETLAPNSDVTQAFITSGTYLDIDDDPDAPDSNIIIGTAASACVTSHGFTTPAASLRTGAGLQAFRTFMFTIGASNTNVTIELREAGVFRASLGTIVAIAGGSGLNSVETVTWDAALLADVTGADVEIYMSWTTTGGDTVRIDAVDWVAAEVAADLVLDHYDEAGTPVNVASTVETAPAAWLNYPGFGARGRWSACGLWEDRTKFAGCHYSVDAFANYIGVYGRTATWTHVLGANAPTAVLIGHTLAGEHFEGLISRVRLPARERSLKPAPRMAPAIATTPLVQAQSQGTPP